MIGTLGFVAISIALVVQALSHLGSRTPLEVASSVLVLATSVGLGVGFFAAMRGTWTRPSAAPLELLDDLERRHQGRRKLMLVTVVAIASVVAGTLAISVVDLEHQGWNARRVFSSLAPCVLMLGFAAVVHRRVSRTIDRELWQADEMRRLLRDSVPPGRES